MPNVTSDDFAARLLRSAEQAAAIKSGATEAVRRIGRKAVSRINEADEIEATRVEPLIRPPER
ncbi:MAG TPA: hypothetical protein VF710_09135 [Longimicrobium sp.]|jgi:hypothetical protein